MVTLLLKKPTTAKLTKVSIWFLNGPEQISLRQERSESENCPYLLERMTFKVLCLFFFFLVVVHFLNFSLVIWKSVVSSQALGVTMHQNLAA